MGETDDNVRIGDPMGQMLLDYLDAHGPTGDAPSAMLSEERDDGRVFPAGDDGRFFRPVWHHPDEWCFARVRGRVLDVGAGAGRVARFLQGRGHHVTALDVSPGAVEVCRRLGLSDVRLGRVEELFGPGTAERFDTIVLMGGNLYISGSAAERARFFGLLAGLLTDGGSLIGQGQVPRVDFPDPSPSDRAYGEKNVAEGRPRGDERRRGRYGDIVSPWFSCFFPDHGELEDVLRAAGLRVTDRLEVGTGYCFEARAAQG